MKKTTDKKIIKKTISVLTTLAFLLSPCALLWAGDYPAEYLGPGHREYLSGKIQSGYYVEVFTKMDLRQKERVHKRNQTEEILNFSYQANPQSAQKIQGVTLLQKYNSNKMKQEIAMQHQQREAGATAQGEFTYIPYSDGKKVYFTDGLATRIENERVLDEYGNVNIKNTYFMRYNDKRLLVEYNATLKDNLGNITRQHWYGVNYTADSLFYGGKDTVANRNIAEYWLEEIDSAGNVKLTHWEALSYDGKLVRAFHQRIEDSIYGIQDFTRTNITYHGNDPDLVSSYHEEGKGTDGLAYALDRTNISYNDKSLVTGYHEERITTQIDGTQSTTIVDAQFTYLDVPHQFGPDVEEADPDRLLESVITTTTINADGSERTETTTTKYEYDGNQQLIGASGHNVFTGQESDWYEYTDGAGHTLARNVDEHGTITYTYVDPDTNEVITVPEERVTATLKEGNKYSGTSETQYEILYGIAMAQQEHSIVSYYGNNIAENELLRIEDSTITYSNGLENNLRRVLGSQEHTEVTDPLRDPGNSHQETRDITTTYFYDENGNLIGAQGAGEKSGWEYSDAQGWYGEHTSIITQEYDVILGKPVKTDYYEDKDYLY